VDTVYISSEKNASSATNNFYTSGYGLVPI